MVREQRTRQLRFRFDYRRARAPPSRVAGCRVMAPASPDVVAAALTVLLAKVDEEVEVDGHVYKLGTNEYSGSVINPDGFLYLQQVALTEMSQPFHTKRDAFS